MIRNLLMLSCLLLCVGSCAKPVCLQPNYPESLKAKAKPLEPFAGTTADDLVGSYVQCTGSYYALANVHNGLVNALGESK